MKRRDMLKFSGLTILVARPRMLFGETAAAAPPPGAPKNAAAMSRRPFGKAGEQLSIVGLGGLVLARLDQEKSNRLVAEAAECGINYFDVAPEYGDAEVKMGPALQPYRKNCFLACKTGQRTAEGSRMELARSLERLKTDHLDLYQLHHIRKVAEDVDAVFAKGGAWEAIEEARKDGRIRHVGFSAHTEEAAIAALDRFDFDSAMFPVSFSCWFAAGYGLRTMEKARAKGAAVLALKSLCRQRWPQGPREPGPFARMWYQPVSDPEEQGLAVRWSLSQPVTAVLPPANDILHRRAFEVGLAYAPVTAAETEKLKKIAAGLNPLFKPGQEP